MIGEGLITNKVAESEIEVLNLAEFHEGLEEVDFDLFDFLFEGLILREKDFRMALKEIDWSSYEDKIVSVFCSSDAIIPTWASMLVSSKLANHARFVGYGDAQNVREQYFSFALTNHDWSKYKDKPVVVKGCGDSFVSKNAYLLAVKNLQDQASKIMFGEPCSSVPIWRKKTSSAPRGVAVKAKPNFAPTVEQKPS